MAWIQVIHEDEATGELGEYYDNKKGKRVSNIQKIMSLNPGAMVAIEAFQSTWQEHGALTVMHREMVAVVTSALNRCQY